MRRLTELKCRQMTGISDELPEVLKKWRPKKRWSVHLAGLGDVGRSAALGLCLLGGGVISRIGLYDLNQERCRYVERELSQIASPDPERLFPPVRRISEKELFGSELFVFCATKMVPELGSEGTDVRLAQYEANSRIVAQYAKRAADAGYGGLFLIVSDPVDLLCMAALRASAEGKIPLKSQQIRGCGLGVMNGRARDMARRWERFGRYLEEGRVFGPHGEGLVVADSTLPGRYRDEVSRELTELTVHANLEIRGLGYKPYIAPAISSAALTLIDMLEGKWNDSAACLGGLYFGARNRLTQKGTVWEETELPEKLFERVEASYRDLEKRLWD